MYANFKTLSPMSGVTICAQSRWSQTRSTALRLCRPAAHSSLSAGLTVTAVLGLSILVSYHEKLDSFLADLAAEEGPQPQVLPIRPAAMGSLRQISERGPEFGISAGKAD